MFLLHQQRHCLAHTLEHGGAPLLPAVCVRCAGLLIIIADDAAAGSMPHPHDAKPLAEQHLACIRIRLLLTADDTDATHKPPACHTTSVLSVGYHAHA